MFHFRDLPIRRKLTLIILFTSAAALMLATGAMAVYEALLFRHSLVRELFIKAEIVAANSSAALAFSDHRAGREILGALKAQPGIVHACLFTVEGEIFTEFKRGKSSSFKMEPHGYRFEKDAVLVFRPVKFNRELVGTIGLRSNLREQHERLKASASIAVAALLAALFVALILSIKLQKLISSPVLELAEIAHQVTLKKNYSLRAKKRSNDEIGKLMEEFNQMLAQIEKSDADLRASEGSFRQMAESIREVFWLTNLDKTEVFYISPGFETIWGRPCAELDHSARIWLDSIHGEDKARVLHAATTKQISGEYDEEYRVIRPDGEIRWIHDRAFPVYDETGKVYRLAGIAEDITKRKHAEEALQRAEAKYRNIFENAIEGIFQTSPDGRCLAANPALSRMLGYGSPDELIWTVADLSQQFYVAPATRAELNRQLEENGEVRELEIQLRRKDNRTIWVSVNVRVERNDRGEILFYEGSSYDITERRRMEEALLQSEAQYRQLVELAQEGIWAIDADGNTTYANPHMAEMLGYTMEEMTGKHLFAFMADSAIELCKINLDRRQRGIAESHEFEFVRKNGVRVLTRMETAPIVDAAGVYRGAIACVSNITESRRAEETLRRTEQLYRQAIAGAGAIPYAYEYKSQSYLFMGEGIEKLTGYSRQEVRPAFWKTIKQESIMLGEMAGLTVEEAGKKIAAGKAKSWQCDMRILTRHGKSRWISDVAVQNVDESGHLIGTMGILQDITERKQTEKQNAAFSLLASQLSAATTPTQAAENILSAAEELIGWDSGFVHLYDRQRDCVGPILTLDLVDGKKILDSSINLNEPSPMTRWILNKGAMLIDPQNRDSMPFKFVPFGDKNRASRSMMYVPIRQSESVIGVLSIQRYAPNNYGSDDLRLLQALADHCSGALQRIQITEQLREAEAKYRGIFEDFTAGIFQTTPDGRYLSVNPATVKMFGYDSAEEMIARVVDIENQNYVLPEKRRELKRLLESEGSVQGFEAECIRKDGSKFWISITGRVVRNTDGSVLCYEGTSRDITSRRHLEKQLIEISDREQSRMGQDLHDGLCQHLVRTAFAVNLLEKDSAQIAAPIEQIKKVSQLVDNAITQARNLARGLYPVKLEVEGLHSAMQELAANIRTGYNLDCQFEASDSVSIPDHAVATHLYRIAQEAATNAVKHAKPTRIQMRLQQTDGKTQLTISDDGEGIPSAGTRDDGMGLHIMSYRAGMIGGSLKIEPHGKRGTIVSCIFEPKNGIEKAVNPRIQ